MIFWASAEVFEPAFAALGKVHQYVESALNAALAGSSFEKLEGKLRYVPIIMPDDMRERYPARSKLKRKAKIYDCSPQLEYNVFIEGKFPDQLREYIRGIAASAPHLADLGASPEQIDEFLALLARIVEQILAATKEDTRH
jgi:hypothetical protein